jgi:hypothetical protein
MMIPRLLMEGKSHLGSIFFESKRFFKSKKDSFGMSSAMQNFFFVAVPFSLQNLVAISISIFGFLIAFSLPVVAQNPAGNAWHYHSTARFVIAYREADEFLSIRILDELQQRQQQLANRLGYQPRRAITVFLCPTQQIFDRMTGGAVPHWGEAAADVAQWRIFLKTPAASDARTLLPVTVTHELAHLCLAELAAPNFMPRWFNEGAAILLSGESRYADPTLISRALITNSIIEFDRIDDLLSFPSAQAGLAYAESYHAVSFMSRQFGSDAIRKFAQSISMHGEARPAYRAAFGEDLWDFEVTYFDYLRQRFRWYFLLDESFLFGGVILLLLLLGFFLTRRRAKKKMQEWEAQEEEASEEPLPPGTEGHEK